MDLLIINGRIYTSEGNVFSWMAIKDGLIYDLGYEDHYRQYDSQEILDLEGKTILPGFFDSHVHLVQTGLNFEGVDLNHVKSIKELLFEIEDSTKNIAAGDLIRAYRFDVTKIKEGRFPTRYELDQVSPNHPVWINSIEFHMSALNSLALHRINLPYNIDGIARDERNLPLGYFTGKASAFIRNRMFSLIDDKLRLKGMKRAIDFAASKGITSLHIMEGGYTFHEKDVSFILEHIDNLPIDLKLYFQTFDLNKVEKYQLNCLGGDIFIDGSFGARTAAISENYSDYDTKGKLYFNQNELNHYVLNAHKKGLQIALHAIGDLAIDQAINAYENATMSFPRYDHRHRIEHFELSTERQMRKASQLKLVISVQPTFEFFWGEAGGMYERRLGVKRASKTNNFRKMIDYGLILCGGSDSDVNKMDPILGIHSAVNHPKKEFSVSVEEAVKMFTYNAAYASFEEEKKGSLTKGKLADFVILNDDIFTVASEKIKDIKVLYTYKEGQVIYSNLESRGNYE